MVLGMNSTMSFFPPLIIALPLLALAVTSVMNRSLYAGRVGGTLNGFAFVLALVLLVQVSTQGPVAATLGSGDDPVAGFYADRLVAVLLLLVTGLSAVVQVFASRYLQGDLRSRRFFTGANLLTAATASMIASVTLIGMAAAWTVSGLALLMLLGMYPGLKAAEIGQRRTAKAFLAGDLALWSAVLIASLEWGNLDLSNLDAGALKAGDGELTLTLVACLVVVAALSRSAQIPFQNWLPSTLAVPTPVSALLHAGVVNAGGILLVRTSPVFGESAMATHLAFFAGAATAAYGTALMLSKPDVKGALAHSTTGQMGFMIMTCGLGAWAATIFHLIAHGMYKASLFLGSGSAVRHRVRNQQAPPPPRPARHETLRAGAFSVLMPAVVILAAAAVFYPDRSPASSALLLFAWATAAWVTMGWLKRRPGTGGILTAALAIAVAGSLYVLALGAATAFLEPAVAEAGQSTVSPWWLALLLPGLLIARPQGLTALRFAEIRKTAYVMALGAAQVRPAANGWTNRLRLPSTTSVGRLDTGSQGVRT